MWLHSLPLLATIKAETPSDTNPTQATQVMPSCMVNCSGKSSTSTKVVNNRALILRLMTHANQKTQKTP